MNLYIWKVVTHGDTLEESLKGFPEEVQKLLLDIQAYAVVYPFPDGTPLDEAIRENINRENQEIAKAIAVAQIEIERRKNR